MRKVTFHAVKSYFGLYEVSPFTFGDLILHYYDKQGIRKLMYFPKLGNTMEHRLRKHPPA